MVMFSSWRERSEHLARLRMKNLIDDACEDAYVSIAFAIIFNAEYDHIESWVQDQGSYIQAED